MLNKEVIETMNRLEQQILVHSIIYYRLGSSIWSDEKWNTISKQLQVLVSEYPDEFKASLLYDDYKGFSWVSGYDLPLYHEGYTKKAVWLLGYHEQLERKGNQFKYER